MVTTFVRSIDCSFGDCGVAWRGVGIEVVVVVAVVVVVLVVVSFALTERVKRCFGGGGGWWVVGVVVVPFIGGRGVLKVVTCVGMMHSSFGVARLHCCTVVVVVGRWFRVFAVYGWVRK